MGARFFTVAAEAPCLRPLPEGTEARDRKTGTQTGAGQGHLTGYPDSADKDSAVVASTSDAGAGASQKGGNPASFAWAFEVGCGPEEGWGGSGRAEDETFSDLRNPMHRNLI